MGYEAVEKSPSFTDHNRTLTLQEGEKVFAGGWKIAIGEAYACSKHPEGRPYARQWRKFSPTTSPADAMAVLEKCAEKVKPWKDDAEISIRLYSDGTWVVLVRQFDWEDYSACEVNAPTLPLAISKFAYRLFKKD